MSGPWKKLTESAPEDHHIFKLRTLQVEDPRTGKAWPRVTLDCPDWVNVVAVTTDDRLVLIRQFRFGAWKTTLEIPGGMLDPGEDALAAAARELEEETGFRPRHVVPLGITEPNPAMQNNRLHHFLATGCVQVHQGEQDESEDIEVELVPVSKVDELVMTGEIEHALVITAFYLWRLKERGPYDSP
ncbi:MAG: NUDIX hydrolase [Archangiaceae bacterium]|nr:NUDIX hydrolase [Archangiaceae bacterium]